MAETTTGFLGVASKLTEFPVSAAKLPITAVTTVGLPTVVCTAELTQDDSTYVSKWEDNLGNGDGRLPSSTLSQSLQSLRGTISITRLTDLERKTDGVDWRQSIRPTLNTGRDKS
jgi:hypothetical protein